MPDGLIYVVTSYALTVLVLAGYAVRLAARGRDLRRRQEALVGAPRADGSLATDAVTTREPSHV